ncbi:MAG: hypothetical protein JO353_07850 [Phycisphaerae bacterium]|nr:hypothetical protein [Phycisphaerae bacterium]
MTEVQTYDLHAEIDPMVFHAPRWLSMTIAGVAEAILILFTLVIIAAMWLPAYLTHFGSSASVLLNANPNHRMNNLPRQR